MSVKFDIGKGAYSVDIISALHELKKSKQFKKYIEHIRFPRFKTLRPGSRIDFDFPFTVLIGSNGTNKSSLLRAIWGCPGRNNIGNYWFSTDLDKIPEPGEEIPHCFIYGYKLDADDDRLVEVLKTRINLKDSPDYWEPSRPIVAYGMKPMPPLRGKRDPNRSQTRWNPIQMDVLYLDFREILCAYDKYFYFGDFKPSKRLASKQERIRNWSKSLREIADKNLRTYKRRNREKLIMNRILSNETVDTISNIIGKHYSTIRVIEHTLFDNKPGTTVLLKGESTEYSEAFAGSGESAIVIAIDKISRANPNSLILLDEPETSLHPGAQKKFREYLLEKIKRDKHQIVLATHSPNFVESLPQNAIKLLIPGVDEKITIVNETEPEAAFSSIGFDSGSQIFVYVEDPLAKVLVESVLMRFYCNIAHTFHVGVFLGGPKTSSLLV